MPDFKANIQAIADLGKATSDINNFINQTRKLTVDVDLKMTNAGQNLANILNQLQGQARGAGNTAGAQFASAFNGSLGQINVTQFTGSLNELRTALSRDFKFDTAAVDNITKDIDKMGVSVQSVQTKLGANGGLNLSVKGTDQLGRAVTVTRNYDKALQPLGTTLNAVAKAEKMVSDSQLKIAGNNLTAWASNNSKAAAEYGEKIRILQERMQSMQNNGATQSMFKQWQDDVRVLQSEAKASGNIGKTFADSFGSAFNSMLKFAASYVSIRKVFSEMENGIRTVVALDDALVDLQKTSAATPQQLNNFYNEANNIAKQYGTTTQQIIQGAADWSRLGYSLEDSKTMSKLSSQFAAISPGMSVDESTTGLVSTMKAFGISSDEVLSQIMDKVNLVGNNFALTNADIMTALKNSSSAMAVANNSLEETIALITAGTEIVQDSSKVGNGLRTISMRKPICAYVQKCA